MTKRVAWFTGEPSVKGRFTPYKVYEVVREETTNFSVINDKGVQNFCLKKGCDHICHKDWVFADVVEEGKQATTEVVEQTKPEKAKKWSKWYKNTTGKCPEGLKRKQKIKLKWSDGDKFNIGKPHDAAWYIDKGGVNITHYKVKLKDISKDVPTKDSKAKQNTDWQDNVLGVCPVPPNKVVEAKLQCGEILKWQADSFNWGETPTAGRKIVKWRLAD